MKKVIGMQNLKSGKCVKTFGVVVVLVFVFTAVSFAKQNRHEEKEYSESTAADYAQVVSAGFGIFGEFVNYERAVNNENSIVAGIDYRSWDAVSNLSVSGIGVEAAYRWWLHNKEIWLNNEKLLSGWYAGPMANLFFYNGKYTFTSYYTSGEYTGTFNTFGLGVQLGYQVVLDNKFVFNISTGAGYNMGIGDASTTTTKSSGYDTIDTAEASVVASTLKGIASITMYGRISVGYAF